MATAVHTRRALLRAIPVIPVVAAAPALAEQASPIVQLFREWEYLYKQAGDLSVDEDIANSLLDRCRVLEKQILALPAQSAADFAAKLITDTGYGDFCLTDGDGGLMHQAAALLA